MKLETRFLNFWTNLVNNIGEILSCYYRQIRNIRRYLETK